MSENFILIEYLQREGNLPHGKKSKSFLPFDIVMRMDRGQKFFLICIKLWSHKSLAKIEV